MPQRDRRLSYWFGMMPPNGRPCIVDVATIKTLTLVQPARVYSENSQQALILSRFPYEMYKIGRQFKGAEMAACLTVMGNAYCELYGGTIPPDKLAQIHLLKRQYVNGVKQPPIDIISHMASPNDLHEPLDDQTAAVYDNLMSAQLILCWTAFETLANDLWEAALNEHPQTLATMASKNISLGGKTGKQDGKSVQLSYLEENKYRIENKMGTILLDQRGPFRKMEQIQEAYQLSFPKGCAIADPTFWDNANLKSTSALRNLLIHTSGNVDDDFLTKRGGDARLAHYQLGDPVYLDGKLLSELLTGLFSFANKLISEVDDWIVSNPS